MKTLRDYINLIEGMKGMISKQEAGYIDQSTSQNHCAGCTMFRAPHSCTLVEGTINPEGVCKHYESK